MSAVFPLAQADRIQRRVLLALELVDPITGRLAGHDLSVQAKGFSPPTVTRLGQIVWTDPEPPADRTVAIEVAARRGQFAPYTAVVTVPARGPHVPVVVHRDVLVPTGLYEPPPGRLGAAGMLVENTAADVLVPVPDATVTVMLQSQRDATPLDSAETGTTDARGGFVAMVGPLGDDAPMSRGPPAPEGAVIAWLRIKRADITRHSPMLPMRNNRLYRAPQPFGWANLSQNPPPLPPAP